MTTGPWAAALLGGSSAMVPEALSTEPGTLVAVITAPRVPV